MALVSCLKDIMTQGILLVFFPVNRMVYDVMFVVIAESWKAIENWFSEVWKVPDFSRFHTCKGLKNVQTWACVL